MTAMDLRTEEDVQAFLPVYVAVDTSASMNQVTESGQLQIDVANEIVPAIVEVWQGRSEPAL